MSDLGAINGTLLGLLGLLLAFTFGMASSRYDTRRQLVIEEANDIGTVILRTDFFPDTPDTEYACLLAAQDSFAHPLKSTLVYFY